MELKFKGVSCEKMHMTSILVRYGINGKITKWIRNFLVGRKQRVKVNGTLYTINMGRSDQRYTTGQCLGTHPICPVHK